MNARVEHRDGAGWWEASGDERAAGPQPADYSTSRPCRSTAPGRPPRRRTRAGRTGDSIRAASSAIQPPGPLESAGPGLRRATPDSAPPHEERHDALPPPVPCPGRRRATLAIAPVAPALAQTQLKMNISEPELALRRRVDASQREVEKRTRALQVQNFYSGALGAERESIEALQVAPLDLTMTLPSRCRTSSRSWRSSTSPSCSATTRTRAPCSTARSARTCCRSSGEGIVALAWGRDGFRHMTNSKRPCERARRPQGPQDADHGEPGPHPGLQGVGSSRRGCFTRCSPRCSRHGGRPGDPCLVSRCKFEQCRST